MKVELTKAECNNTKIALVTLSKSQDVPENAMIEILNLSQKFNWVEEEKAIDEPVNKK